MHLRQDWNPNPRKDHFQKSLRGGAWHRRADHGPSPWHRRAGARRRALLVSLMNQAQDVLYAEFPQEVIRAGVERLWQPSAYVGSYGDLASPQIQKYIHDWQAGCAFFSPIGSDFTSDQLD